MSPGTLEQYSANSLLLCNNMPKNLPVRFVLDRCLEPWERVIATMIAIAKATEIAMRIRPYLLVELTMLVMLRNLQDKPQAYQAMFVWSQHVHMNI